MEVIKYYSDRGTGKTTKGLLSLVAAMTKNDSQGLVISRYPKTKIIAKEIFSEEILKRIIFLEYGESTQNEELRYIHNELIEGSSIFIDDAIDEHDLGSVLISFVKRILPKRLIIAKSIPPTIKVFVRTEEEKAEFGKFLSQKSGVFTSFSSFAGQEFNGVPVELVVNDGLKGFEWLK